jgi:hypothetical protein
MIDGISTIGLLINEIPQSRPSKLHMIISTIGLQIWQILVIQSNKGMNN